jgi:hypothetical protein
MGPPPLPGPRGPPGPAIPGELLRMTLSLGQDIECQCVPVRWDKQDFVGTQSSKQFITNLCAVTNATYGSFTCITDSSGTCTAYTFGTLFTAKAPLTLLVDASVSTSITLTTNFADYTYVTLAIKVLDKNKNCTKYGTSSGIGVVNSSAIITLQKNYSFYIELCVISNNSSIPLPSILPESFLQIYKIYTFQNPPLPIVI